MPWIFSDVFSNLQQAVEDYFDPANLGGQQATLSGLASFLSTVSATSPFPSTMDDNPLENLGDLSFQGTNTTTFSYGGDGALEVAVDFDFLAQRMTTFDLDLGSEAELIGLTVDAPITTTSALDGGLKLGLTGPLATSPEFYTENVNGNDLIATIEGDATIDGASVNFGFLEASIGTPSLGGKSVEFEGALDVLVTGTGGRVTGIDLMDTTNTPVNDLFNTIPDTTIDLDLVTTGNQPVLTDLPVTADLGVVLKGTNAPLDPGNIGLGFPSGKSVFLAEGEAPTVTATNTQGVNLLDFSNTTPTEVLGLLDQVIGALADLSNSDGLGVAIPLAGGRTVGDVLDFAQRFRSEVLDVLVQGDSTDPDRDDEGNPILLFEGAQELASLLPGVVNAVYDPDPTIQELTFDINITAAPIGKRKRHSANRAGGRKRGRRGTEHYH